MTSRNGSLREKHFRNFFQIVISFFSTSRSKTMESGRFTRAIVDPRYPVFRYFPAFLSAGYAHVQRAEKICIIRRTVVSWIARCREQVHVGSMFFGFHRHRSSKIIPRLFARDDENPRSAIGFYGARAYNGIKVRVRGGIVERARETREHLNR